MAAVKFLRDVTIAPRQMLFLLSSLVTADDKDAEEMARASRFTDHFFDQLWLGVTAQDLDVLAARCAKIGTPIRYDEPLAGYRRLHVADPASVLG